MPRSLTQIRKTLTSSFDEMTKAHKDGNKTKFNKELKRFDKADKELRKRGAELQTGSKMHMVKPRKKR